MPQFYLYLFYPGPYKPAQAVYEHQTFKKRLYMYLKSKVQN